jgi:hypothetical protein
MNTKTFRFDTDVLTVLSAMQFKQENGSTVGILTGQLDRSLYVRVNKALELLGGKWNRKIGGHIFATDPRQQLDGLTIVGEITVNNYDFFETPREVVLKMLAIAPLARSSQIVLEPSAGKGAILDVLFEQDVKQHLFHVCEIDPKLIEYLDAKYGERIRVVGFDFLEYPRPTLFAYDRIYANPPFSNGQDVLHVRHMYDLLADGGKLVSVMGEHAFFADDNRSKAFRDWLTAVGGESVRLPDNSFKDSGTNVHTRLVWITR